MFRMVPSDRPGFLSAQISEDNLIITWDSALSEPPWNDLYMEKYHKQFMQAVSDWNNLRRLESGPTPIVLEKAPPNLELF